MKISTCTPNPFPRGIDITAPGGIEKLLEFHRGTFGDWQMNANAGAGDGGNGDGTGEPGGGAGGDGEPGGEGGSGGSGDGDKGLKSALQAEREAAKTARTELAAAQARLKELEDASKSEEQRQQEAQEQLKTNHAKVTTDLAAANTLLERYRVAAEKGLDLRAAERLKGSTREEIESDAEDLLTLLGGGAGQRQDQHRGDPGQGPRGTGKESSYELGAERARTRFGSKQQ